MNGFASSLPGRSMFAAFGLAFAGGGLSAFLSPPASLYLMSLSMLVAITTCILALPHAIEAAPELAIECAIGLPVGLFLYMVGLGAVIHYLPEFAYVFVGVGFGSFGLALRPSRGRSAEAPRTFDQPATQSH